MKITRTIEQSIKQAIQENSLIKVIYGARQVGKTFLCEKILLDYDDKDIIRLNGDIIVDREGFDFTTGQSVEKFIGTAKVLFIDEAQRFVNIGLNLKIIYDRQLPIQIIVTGSSSLDIASNVHEPLTGRMLSWTLYPLSVQELITTYNIHDTRKKLEDQLIYGTYPDIFLSTTQQAVQKLQQLTSNYLYKDILEYAGIRKSDMLIKLLRLLAFQIGGEVNYYELGQQLGISAETVAHYISLLEESFVLIRLGSWSTNLRNEVKKSQKIYFVDLGVRNTLINNWNTLDLRDDVGKLRENFIVLEKIKYSKNNQHYDNFYFWRNYQQQEIDLVEESAGVLHAYEIKRNPNKKNKDYAYQIDAQPVVHITPDNYLDLLG